MKKIFRKINSQKDSTPQHCGTGDSSKLVDFLLFTIGLMVKSV